MRVITVIVTTYEEPVSRTFFSGDALWGLQCIHFVGQFLAPESCFAEVKNWFTKLMCIIPFV